MEYQTFKEELCRILQKRTEGKKKRYFTAGGEEQWSCSGRSGLTR